MTDPVPTPSASTKVLETLSETEPDAFVQNVLLGMLPVLFDSEVEYEAWLATLAEYLGVRAGDLHIVGTARTGVSFSPDSTFKGFEADSDIDVAIISDSLFEEAWERLRNWGVDRLSMPDEAKTSFRNHKRQHIFWETIATDELLAHLPFGKRWMIAFADMAREGPAEGRVINARIYRNMEALVTYQSKGVTQAKEKLSGG